MATEALSRPASSAANTRRNVLLFLLVTAGILNYADRQVIAVLKPMLQHSLGWSDRDYGDMTSVFQFAAAVAYLGAGWFVDKVGWRRANPIAVGTWSLAAMSHALAHTLGQFTVARVALGATEALGTPTALKTVAVFFSAKSRSFAMGAMNASNNLGAIVTPLLVPLLALNVGWQATFLLIGGLGLIWALAWVLAASGEVAVAEHPAPTAEQAAEEHGSIWHAVLTDRATWAIAGAKVLSDQVWWFLLFWTPDMLQRVFHLDMRSFGLPLAIIYGVAGLGSIVGGYASGRMLAAGFSLNAARKLTMLVCALLVTPVPLLLIAGNVWVAVGLLSLTLAAHQGFSVNLFALTADVAPNSRVASVISVGALCGNLAGMVILQVAGRMFAAGYGYGPLLILAAVSYLLALGWVQLLLPRIEARN